MERTADQLENVIIKVTAMQGSAFWSWRPPNWWW